MIEFYPQIKMFHVTLAVLSGSLFAVRCGCSLTGARWPHALPVKWLSYAVDTALLTAALMLLTMLPWAMFGNGWLLVKVALVVVYVVLGVLAMRARARTTTRARFYAAALLVLLSIYAIARAHHPLGPLASVFG